MAISAIEPVTPAERSVLRNALGLAYSNTAYRNHFVAGWDTDTGQLCQQLCAKGLMLDRGSQPTMSEYHVFQVTESGKAAAREHTTPHGSMQ